MFFKGNSKHQFWAQSYSDFQPLWWVDRVDINQPYCFGLVWVVQVRGQALFQEFQEMMHNLSGMSYLLGTSECLVFGGWFFLRSERMSFPSKAMVIWVPGMIRTFSLVKLLQFAALKSSRIFTGIHLGKWCQLVSVELPNCVAPSFSA